jgi:hypothetical protein
MAIFSLNFLFQDLFINDLYARLNHRFLTRSLYICNRAVQEYAVDNFQEFIWMHCPIIKYEEKWNFLL